MISEESLKIRMETNDAAVVIRDEKAIINLDGMYVRGIFLREGTRLRIRISQGGNVVSVEGVACRGGDGNGVAIHWERMSGDLSRRLASILGVVV